MGLSIRNQYFFKCNNNKSIKIWIDNVDKIRRKEKVEVKKEYNNNNNNNNNKPILQDKEETNDYNQFTEIVVYLPKISVDYIKIYKLLQKYIVFNTHINFNIQLPSQTKVERTLSLLLCGYSGT